MLALVLLRYDVAVDVYFDFATAFSCSTRNRFHAERSHSSHSSKASI